MKSHSMRRKRASAGVAVLTRTGVTASVRHRKRCDQSPSERSRFSCGFAPRLPVTAAYDSHRYGSNATANATGFAAGCMSSFDALDAASIVLLQVHAGVQ